MPFTVTRVFQGLCGFGKKPTWRRFGYTSSTPGSTSIEFRFHAFDAAADGTCVATAPVTTSPPNPLATASQTQNPQVCSTSDASCVLDLNQYLGVTAGKVCLQLDAYGRPDTTGSPKLDD